MATAEIDTIDVQESSKDIVIQSIHDADVIVTRSDLAEKLKELVDVSQKKIISVGSTNDVSLLLNMS
ncbi:hypothetical protein SAMN04487944_11598 [Gracilibacillus ureilyticus]|uniref:Uncharacterized protein n=1 Tax=Gracilibacillus ureilyticus TaxID=531814 RepID=A0A1H9U0G2_9BACI|nr:hypothetical protein [Gracilibacillus ureilyticus]SES02738.1 hypothetical protein SAMN04487944_11598 [Gracilibacillus ureilyticus]